MDKWNMVVHFTGDYLFSPFESSDSAVVHVVYSKFILKRLNLC